MGRDTEGPAPKLLTFQGGQGLSLPLSSAAQFCQSEILCIMESVWAARADNEPPSPPELPGGARGVQDCLEQVAFRNLLIILGFNHFQTENNFNSYAPQ